MLGLAFIGIIDAFYDSYAIYNGQLLWSPLLSTDAIP